ncbi:uncharacterized protein [Miscanthus floridulus]|uniref:uncharacterized protein n=1 Tax=Miscanthus floridulus TaxID=154761 RepID=UPI0034598082
MQRAPVYRHRQAAARDHVCAIGCTALHVYIQRYIHAVPALALQFFYSGNNTSCPLETSNPAACRSKRRKLLNQHRLVWRGAASRHSADLDCGQFDEAFVEALKVSYPGRSYYGPPDQQCCNCRAIFWHAERIGKDSQGSSGSVIYNRCNLEVGTCQPLESRCPKSSVIARI